MRKIIAKAIYAISFLYGVAIFIIGFMAYFMRTFDPVNHLWYDGLGRLMLPTPMIARFIFSEDSEWAGWGWFAVDVVAFWSSVAILVGLITLAGKIAKSK